MTSRSRLFGSAALAAVVAICLWLVRSRSSDVDRRPTASDAAALASSRPRAPFGAPGHVFLIGGESAPAPADTIGELSGRVVSSHGDAPIAAASITIVGPGPALSIVTNADGSFAIHPTEEGVHEVMLVTHPDYLPFASELGSSPVTFRAKKGARVSGITLRLVPAIEYTAIVLDPKDHRVANATLELHDADDQELSLKSLPSRHTTDANGEARFRAPDLAIVEARADGYAPGRAELGFTARIARRVTIRLAPNDPAETASGAIEGVVVDAAGAAIAGASVIAKREIDVPASERARLDPGAAARTDEGGRFRLGELVAGTYRITASDGEHAPAVATGVDANARSVRLVMDRGVTLRGRVVDAVTHAPIASVSVVVAERYGPLVVHPTRTATVFDAEGGFVVDRLPKGTYVVNAAAEGYAPSPDRDVKLDADASIDIALKRGVRVSGVVRDGSTKSPIAGASVSLEGRWGASEGTASLTPVAITDASGRFAIAGLAAGKVSFLAGAERHHGRVFGVTIEEGVDPAPFTVELAATKDGEEPRIELVGIGAVLSAKDDALIVGNVLPGGGAAEVGIVPGDAVVAVDGVTVTKLGFEGAVAGIRGPEDSVVTLVVRRGDGTISLRVPRRRVRS